MISKSALCMAKRTLRNIAVELIVSLCLVVFVISSIMG